MEKVKQVNEFLIDPKKQNKDRILGLFFEHEVLSKPQIVELTGYSLPTVNGHMKDLEAEGYIGAGELLDSSGGRPAVSYKLQPHSRLAIGVELRKNYIKICLCDLVGELVNLRNIGINYEDSTAYFKNLNSILHDFIDNCGYPKTRILGIGIAFQGVVNKEGNTIIFSKIISATKMDLQVISKDLGVPVRLCHDVKSAALAEIWHNRDFSNAIYIALSEHMGGALIKSRCIEHGRNGYAGSWDHLTINSRGKRCYCGRRGCLDTYCSMDALLQGENVADFFNKMRLNKSQEHKLRWHKFLSTISLGLYTVWLLLERRIILGGDMAMWLQPEDIKYIEKSIMKRSTFTYTQNFVTKATVLHHAVAIGASLPYLANEIPEHIRPIQSWTAYSSEEND